MLPVVGVAPQPPPPATLCLRSAKGAEKAKKGRVKKDLPQEIPHG